MEAALQKSPSRRNFELRVALVGEGPYSEAGYLLRIPVVLVDGAEAFEAKEMDFEGLWVRRLEGVLGRLVGSPG